MTGTRVISDEQRAALAKLAGVVPDDVYLGGGVAVAAHLGHRRSLDLDLFASSDPLELQAGLERLPGISIQSRSRGTLYLRVDGLPVSLIEYRYPLLETPAAVSGLSVPVASLVDLACMKLSAIVGRGAARDFWDLHAIIVSTDRTLAEYLTEFRRKFPVEDIGHVIRSLVYFADADAEPLPLELTSDRWAQIRADFASWVPRLVE